MATRLMNKGFLLDSHTFLWWLQEPHKLGPKTKKTLQEEELRISVATIWELALKYRKGKLKFSPQRLLRGITELDAALLTIKPEHIINLDEQKLAHKDPFDLMLAAQAQNENLLLLTADEPLLDLRLPFVINAKE